MSAIVYSEGKGRSSVRIAAGLRWVVLDGGLGRGKSQTSQVRIQASSIGSTRYVIQKSEVGDTVGLYNDPLTEDASLTGKVYSLSVLMLSGLLQKEGVDPVGVNAVFLMQPAGLPDKRLLIYIESGQVTLDTILEREKAIDQAKSHIDMSPDAVLYLEHAEIDRSHERMSWEEVAELVDKRASIAVLKAIPISPFLLPVCIIAIASISGWYAYDKLIHQPEVRRQASVLAAKKDKTPAYIAAADQALRSAGWDRANLVDFVSKLSSHPAYVAGWSLVSMSCDLDACISQWSRRGGIVTELQSDLPAESLIVTNPDNDAQSSTIEKSFMRMPHERKASVIERAELKTNDEYLIEIRPIMQRLINAGAVASIGDIKKWDVSSLSGVKSNEIIYQSPFEIYMPFFRFSDVVALLPKNILLQSLDITNNDGSLGFKLKGNAYVRR